MICTECLEKRECKRGAIALYNKECAECGEVRTITFPISKETGEYLKLDFLITSD